MLVSAPRAGLKGLRDGKTQCLYVTRTVNKSPLRCVLMGGVP